MPPLAAAIGRPQADAAVTPALDEESFHLFYNRTARPLRAYLMCALHDRSSTDDLLQETFLRFLKADLPATMEHDHRKNYLFRIATNLIRDHFKSARAVALDDSVSHPGFENDVARRKDLQQVMKELKPRERELLWLAYVEQFSHREIASMVGAKAKSIRPMLARARERLAGLLRLRTGALT
jgi:RNA polymerase sigma-70 factor (ECF subfamily)